MGSDSMEERDEMKEVEEEAIGGQNNARQEERLDRVDRNLGSIKIKTPSFQGKNDAETYLEWKRKVEMIFDYCNYSEEKKVKLVAIEFHNYALVWWDQL